MYGFSEELRKQNKLYLSTAIIFFVEKATELRYQYCYLETVARMWQANLLYQRMGFRKIDGPMGCTGHNSCEAFYVKELFSESIGEQV